MAEPTGDLDDLVHQRVRLGILICCKEARRVEFSFLQESLELTPGNLSRHVRVLEEAGPVRVEKAFVDRRSKTWVALTREGARALSREVAALREIVRRVEQVPGTSTPRPAPGVARLEPAGEG